MKAEITSVRGLVISNWEDAGYPAWDVAQTSREAEQADKVLRILGKETAPCFREARIQRDAAYVRKWTLGCHFPWLNPR